jgi:hypothetical protein
VRRKHRGNSGVPLNPPPHRDVIGVQAALGKEFLHVSAFEAGNIIRFEIIGERRGWKAGVILKVGRVPATKTAAFSKNKSGNVQNKSAHAS